MKFKVDTTAATTASAASTTTKNIIISSASTTTTDLHSDHIIFGWFDIYSFIYLISIIIGIYGILRYGFKFIYKQYQRRNTDANVIGKKKDE